uniref:Uncharacterized protein n=1 Tax=Pyramimonas obovata TaxID=1411642 RepID=A0A7S0RAW0_9CHLO|eukprot:CAMPEP_0118932960 /NCGR_PEP_ID=MMETSP1169-20130426/10806_1 /TAXON_ID=36882 /ORGANISM="Pyramimonas obovata, Strain CCMP722" /LENGTH=240 /DNA_ID=CAMNT_0006875669 /DNA_START=39 /DNA_END=761 /DNA_ORIENTATION=+
MGYPTCTNMTTMRPLGMLKQSRSVASSTKPAPACSRFASRTRFSMRGRMQRTSAKATRFQIFSSTEVEDSKEEVQTPSAAPTSKELNKAVSKAAATFAPRSSTAKKNPATKGTVLYSVFEVQAYVAVVVGALLAYNVIWPSEVSAAGVVDPTIARLMGMWSIWMFTVPSLRARDCAKDEKDALNYAFILIPLVNVLLPLVWKSFGAVFTADVAVLAGLYAWKGVVPFSDVPEEPQEETSA